VEQTGRAAGRLSDWVSLGVLASRVDRDAVDDAVEAAGKAVKRTGGKLPPQVMVYFVMALALFADEDYEEVWARLTETLADWGGFGDDQALVTTGGITQARQRLGEEPVRETFAQVAEPVATLDTAGGVPCYSPRPVPLAILVKVAGIRWTTEENFQAGKGLAGLGEHQVRRWDSWYRWTTLAMLALAFLTIAAATEHTSPPPRDQSNSLNSSGAWWLRRESGGI
jgi:hypothetical protein